MSDPLDPMDDFRENFPWGRAGQLYHDVVSLMQQLDIERRDKKMVDELAKDNSMGDDEKWAMDQTIQHQQKVRDALATFIDVLRGRGVYHDASKLKDPEWPIFCKYTVKLRDTTYGSDEYKQYLAEMKPALDHHYANNRHHPEHFSDGITGMNLIDLVEMFCDWWAATQRHADGDLKKSIVINAGRFGMSDQLHDILMNTAREVLGE